ncbi:MAG: YncE family protein, partial [Rubrobacter sp.]|nr:YncE family protein [Rubrobacter sp.]
MKGTWGSLAGHRLLVAVMVVIALSGCGTEQSKPEKGTAGQAYSPPANPPPAPEPTRSPPLKEKPAGRVVTLGSSPEGVVADPVTGLVAIGLPNPDRLALVDGGSGEVVRRVKLPESPRHLDLAAPGGPVLVPAERSGSLVRIGLPGGKILSETPVGKFPHDAASAPNGRIFVGNEFGNTVSVVEDDRVIKTLE